MVDDTPRAVNSESIAHLPKHKSVVPGLISSRFAEDPKQIADCVDEAAKILGISASPHNMDLPHTSKEISFCSFCSLIDEMGYRERH
jgi:hypothetical protein